VEGAVPPSSRACMFSCMYASRVGSEGCGARHAALQYIWLHLSSVVIVFIISGVLCDRLSAGRE
jgi:hypothetical protein